MFGVVHSLLHSLLISQTGLQIAKDKIKDKDKSNISIICSYFNLPVRQSLSVHPVVQLQVFGAVHSILVSHCGSQIAVLK